MYCIHNATFVIFNCYLYFCKRSFVMTMGKPELWISYSSMSNFSVAKLLVEYKPWSLSSCDRHGLLRNACCRITAQGNFWLCVCGNKIYIVLGRKCSPFYPLFFLCPTIIGPTFSQSIASQKPDHGQEVKWIILKLCTGMGFSLY